MRRGPARYAIRLELAGADCPRCGAPSVPVLGQYFCPDPACPHVEPIPPEPTHA